MWPVKTITSQLPHGIGNNLVAPHAFARSAIFSTQNFRGSGRPHYTQRTQLAAVGDMTIYQLYGHQLDQHDADVMYELLRRVFAQGDGDKREARIRCKRRDLLLSLGRTLGGKSRKLLDESMDRLTMATYEFRIPKVATGISRLVLKALKRETDEIESGPDDPDYDVLLDLELAKIFHFQQWVLLSKAERDKLLDDPLARGLHTYYSTHEEPFPVLPATLKKLTGRETMREDKWLAALLESLKNLKAATGWAVCELAKSGKYAGKVVVQKKKPAAKKPKAKIETQAPEKQEDSAPEKQVENLQSRLMKYSWDELGTLPLETLQGLMTPAARAAWSEAISEPGHDQPHMQYLHAVTQVCKLWDEVTEI